MSLKYFPADWSQYRALQFQIYNPQPEPFSFYFRIHDQLHWGNNSRYSDRFNTSLVARPGWTQMEIPLSEVVEAPKGRKMDLTKIAGVILFVDRLEQSRTFYLDEVKLIH